MLKSDKLYKAYMNILKEELIPAMGCTEPIAIAYGAAYVRDVLGGSPERLDIKVSGNLVKNAKSVVVPGTGGMRGIEAAAAAGVMAGKTERLLEVISEINDEQRSAIKEYIEGGNIAVSLTDGELTFDYIVTAYLGEDTARVRIANFHTNVVLAEKNGERLIDHPVTGDDDTELTDRSLLNLMDILDFAKTAETEDLAGLLDIQIAYNTAIADEGLKGGYGAGVGKMLMESGADSPDIRARAKAAAGSDARMNGCELPVVIVSGSGNQGITASVPVIEFAKEHGADHEKLLRALAVSNLLTIHQKTSIGRLSAFCGAVSAGAGAAAGVCWLEGGTPEQIGQTLINALATSSGMVCDGAKSSCAAKIALSVESGLMGLHMAMRGQVFMPGDGIVGDDVEQTIANVGSMAQDGMRETDREILRIMTGC
jgi:L-cysteine desulfidase